jgi:hypothetical protein
MFLRMIPCALVVSAASLGCGGEQTGPMAFKKSSETKSYAAPQADAVHAARDELADAFAKPIGPGIVVSNPVKSDPLADIVKQAQAIDQTKIIYTGHLSVVAKDFDQAEPKVREIAKKHKGYIADAQVQRKQGTRPSATWIIRTPAADFDDCLHELAGLGVPESQRVATQDVGEEYVDVQSRVTSKKKIEERILEMLKDRKGDLKEVMELEGKLGAIREEIEKAQGRLNYLANRVAFSTINLALREERDYVPPQSPDFAGQVADTWKSSTGLIVKFLQQIAIFAVSIAPWAPVWLLLGVGAWIAARRIRRLAAAPQASA